MKYVYGKYDLGYAGIPRWKDGIPPGSQRMKIVPALYKRNTKFIKKLLYSSRLVYCSVLLALIWAALKCCQWYDAMNDCGLKNDKSD